MWISDSRLAAPPIPSISSLALLILILSPVIILRTRRTSSRISTYPVIAVAWSLPLNPKNGRPVHDGLERMLTTTVDNIEHLSPLTVNGQR